jgi:hypothetical protein
MLLAHLAQSYKINSYGAVEIVNQINTDLTILYFNTLVAN